MPACHFIVWIVHLNSTSGENAWIYSCQSLLSSACCSPTETSSSGKVSIVCKSSMIDKCVVLTIQNLMWLHDPCTLQYQYDGKYEIYLWHTTTAPVIQKSMAYNVLALQPCTTVTTAYLVVLYNSGSIYIGHTKNLLAPLFAFAILRLEVFLLSILFLMQRMFPTFQFWSAKQ